ncbi:trypsin-like peptidase domain-containing protein [Thermoproteota archaeon]
MVNRSLTFVAVISVIAIVFSGANSYFLFNNLQTEQDLQKAVDEVNDRISPIESKQLDLSNQISENFDSLISNINELNANISNLESNVNTNIIVLESNLNSNIVALESSIDSLLSDISNFESNVNSNNIALESRMDSLSLEISQLNDKIEDINIEAFESIIEILKTNITQLSEKLDSYQIQSPKDVYEAVHKSVVVIRTDLGQGSGFIIEQSSTKYILTNWHVVEGASEIDVEFYDRTRSNAIVIGLDAYSDVAVIMPVRTPLDSHPLQLGNSSNLYIGQQVLAIGNPLGLEGSLSTGIISNLNAEVEVIDVPIIVPVIQIDLAIAPGSSGGALFDLDGNVIGITNAGTDYGFNFAIPSNMASRASSSIIDKGYYSHALFGFNSITLTPEIIQLYIIVGVEPSQKGMVITSVTEGMPAENAGLVPAVISYNEDYSLNEIIAKDIILAINNYTIIDNFDWVVYVAENVSPNQTVILTILRSNEIIFLEVTPISRPQYQE